MSSCFILLAYTALLALIFLFFQLIAIQNAQRRAMAKKLSPNQEALGALVACITFITLLICTLLLLSAINHFWASYVISTEFATFATVSVFPLMAALCWSAFYLEAKHLLRRDWLGARHIASSLLVHSLVSLLCLLFIASFLMPNYMQG